MTDRRHRAFCYFICSLFAGVYPACSNLLNYAFRIGPFSCVFVYSGLPGGRQKKNMPMSLFPESSMTKELMSPYLVKEVIK